MLIGISQSRNYVETTIDDVEKQCYQPRVLSGEV